MEASSIHAAFPTGRASLSNGSFPYQTEGARPFATGPRLGVDFASNQGPNQSRNPFLALPVSDSFAEHSRPRESPPGPHPSAFPACRENASPKHSQRPRLRVDTMTSGSTMPRPHVPYPCTDASSRGSRSEASLPAAVASASDTARPRERTPWMRWARMLLPGRQRTSSTHRTEPSRVDAATKAFPSFPQSNRPQLHMGIEKSFSEPPAGDSHYTVYVFELFPG